MEIVKQIKQICNETDNKWFLKHSYTKVALRDLRKRIPTLDDTEPTTWIIHDKIGEDIPGFIFIDCRHGLTGLEDTFNHYLVFACVRQKYRKMGILKKMLSSIPKEWNLWLEANSNDIRNIENIWKKCGFIHHNENYYKKTMQSATEPLGGSGGVSPK